MLECMHGRCMNLKPVPAVTLIPIRTFIIRAMAPDAITAITML